MQAIEIANQTINWQIVYIIIYMIVSMQEKILSIIYSIALLHQP